MLHCLLPLNEIRSIKHEKWMILGERKVYGGRNALINALDTLWNVINTSYCYPGFSHHETAEKNLW